ncbi:YciI family protein [Actinotalea sp.]|uniref:YciI family protein n=1 Tax=Actinotalea sp. TaxID=1872145 RepID=UPI002C03D4EC|nr:YciI family protein [Actinotalea sp.]HQY33262.1 YciI family protein [Actinotalea sp.]HRA50730.1 YciI family protein [Actinotalea sp.]
MTTFAVEYRYDDRADERDEVRPAHRAFLGGLLADGTLLASGPYTDGAAGALLLVVAPDATAAVALLDTDPFWTAGLVADRTVRGWEPVLRVWA